MVWLLVVLQSVPHEHCGSSLLLFFVVVVRSSSLLYMFAFTFTPMFILMFMFMFMFMSMPVTVSISRDLFGDDDVEVVPSNSSPKHGQTARGVPVPVPAPTIEIVVRMSSVTIKCYGSFDVYPKSLVGECEPLIQLHTVTTETISLQEVRGSDSETSKALAGSDSDESVRGFRLVLQERKTSRTGWRTLSIRPALYERVEVYDTRS